MIAATFDPCISDDGRRVSFRYISGGGPLYVGYLNDPDAVPDSPTSHNIVFDPPAMPWGDPDATIIVTSEISDPQGLADIERTSIDELVDGRLESSSSVPVYFYLGYYGGTRDEGDWPDETAGDGIFSNAGRPGGKIDELDQMTVRMGAMDASKTVVIADKVLSIGGVIPTPTPTLTPTPSTTPTETPTPILPPVVTPRPAPEEGPDLTISSTSYGFEDDGRVLVLFVEITNQGNVVAPETLVYAGDIEHDWLHEYGSVQALDPDETTPIEIWLDISEELRGTIRTFRVEVDPEDAVREIDEGNNEAMTLRTPLPLLEEAPIEEPPEDELPLLEVVVTLGAIGGIFFTIRRIFEIRRRNEWQGKAKEEEPRETCQPCTRYCRKIELELEPALRKITHLSFGASDPVSGKQSKERQVRGKLVDGLNKLVMAHRRREKPEKLQEQVAHLAHALLQQIMEWLCGESAPRDVFVTGHLEGGKVTCQFILYHCKRRSTVNVWEEDAKRKATIKDEHDEFVGTLRGMKPTELEIPEQVAPDLTRLLMQFIEKV